MREGRARGLVISDVARKVTAALLTPALCYLQSHAD
jgi:hypothetical protein